MKHYLSILLGLLWITVSCRSQESLVRMTAIPDTSRVTLLFTGDMMGHGPQINAAWNDSDKTYHYLPVFQFVQKDFEQADISVVNLEVTLAGQPYTGYPQFSSPDALAPELRQAGFDLLLTANNHCLDRGKTGLERTIHVLDSSGIPHIGTFLDSLDRAARYPYLVEKNNIRIAFLNYTYGTNGYKTHKPNIVNYIDTTQMKADLQDIRKRHVDFVIVALHWGAEYQRLPNAEQKSIAHFLCNHGTDAIIGSHPHVIQPFDYMHHALDSTKLVPVLYSLGNFVSNQRDRYCDGGIAFSLTLEKNHSTRIKTCEYTPYWVYRGRINNKQQYRLVSPASFNRACTELNISSIDSTKCTQFFTDTREHLRMLQENK